MWLLFSQRMACPTRRVFSLDRGGTLSNTLPNVVAIAEDARTGGPQGDEPRIRTFVIGVGSELTALNQIADAGGTTDAFLVDAEENVEQAFTEALNDIRREALTCNFDIPEPDRGSNR